MNMLLKKATVIGLSTFTIMRWTGLFGERNVVISKKDQRNHNSYGENFFGVKKGLFWDEVVEYEEWAGGQEYRVASHGWSCGQLKIKYEK